jgi:hypothetical protein
MPSAEPGDHQAIETASSSVQQFTVIAEGHRHNTDPHRTAHAVQRHHRLPFRTHQQPHAAFCDIPDRSGRRRGERGEAGGMRLAHPAGGVDLIGKHNRAAEAAHQRAGGYLDGRQDVGRPIMARQSRVAHGPGDSYRGLAVVQQVEQERGLLDGVSALRHHSPGSSRPDAFADQRGQFDDIADGQRRAGNPSYVVDLDVYACRGKAGHRREELVPAQCGDRTEGLAWLPRHRDRAAKGENLYAGGRGMRDGHKGILSMSGTGDGGGEPA